MKASLIVISFTILVVGCDGSSPSGVDVHSAFGIAYHQVVYLSQLRTTITFQDVLSDSRCPVNAFCYTIGEARVLFQLQQHASDTVMIVLSIRGYVTQVDSGKHRSLDTLGLRFTLLQLDPYPTGPPVPQNSKYAALLKIDPQ